MKRTIPVILLLIAVAPTLTTMAQQKPKSTQSPTIASVLDQQLSAVERQVVRVAEAMPEDKYAFTPTSGEFKGVRSFAEQAKHIASANHQFFGAIVGEKAEAGGGENGPQAVKSKDQVLEYLRASFALGHRAIAGINAENAATPLKDSPIAAFNTRLGLASIAMWHAMDHYGQMIEYLRMNGIAPPGARPPQPSPSR